jgi:type I restriction enzyme R subunit
MGLVTEEDLEDECQSWLKGLGYECVHDDEIPPSIEDPDETYGLRARYSDVVLKPRLADAVRRLNPGMLEPEVEAVVSTLSGYASQSLIDGNRQVHEWLRNGVPFERVDQSGHRLVLRARVIDFSSKATSSNDFLAIRQFTVKGNRTRRPDVVLFVNGLPLVVIELKNPSDPNADIEAAYSQIQTYKADISQLFLFNLFNVISDGIIARYGSLTADFSRHSPWRLVDGKKVSGKERAEKTRRGESAIEVAEASSLGGGLMQLEVLVRGLLEPTTLITFLKGFVAYSSSQGAPTTKIIAQWQQYHGVMKAVERARGSLKKRDGKGGVIWFTQGSGKSLLALFYVMALREDPAFENPTIVLVTDRNDLDGQLFETFSHCSDSIGASPVQASSREDLRVRLSEVTAGGVFFTTINKFTPEAGRNTVSVLCDRRNVIVIADEAHRTQYGFGADLDSKTESMRYGMAKYMRQALPNAIYLGMTGTPVSLSDRDTEGVFGSYVDVYDMISAQEDQSVVPVSYESRVIELDFNEAERQSLKNEFLEVTREDDEDAQNRAVSRFTRLEAIAMAEGRLEKLAHDLVDHWDMRLESIPGKAMVVAISRKACVGLYNEIVKLRPHWDDPDPGKGVVKIVMTASSSDPLEFQRHRLDLPELKRIERRFKDPTDPLQIVIVRDMWLTGFDAPVVHTLYVDKPMEGHGLMQAIARTNRVWKDKPGGLVVDYIGIGEELKKAIRQYTRDANSDRDPVDMSGQALAVLLDCVDVIRKEYLHRFDYRGFQDDRQALRLIKPAIDHILTLTEERDDKGRNAAVVGFLDQVSKLTSAQALAGTAREAVALREEIAFFQAIRVSLTKISVAGQSKSRVEKEAVLNQLVDKGVLVGGVKDLFTEFGIGRQDISVLNEAFLERIREMPTKNLAAELLQRLISDQIKSRASKNVVQGKEFTQRLQEAINRYKNRAITTADVIRELIELAKEINAARPPEGMTDEEFAFYQALAQNEEAVKTLGDPALRSLAHELTERIRSSATINWQNRQSARGNMISRIKILLKNHSYPPDGARAAVDRVIEQAELFAESMDD